MTPHRAKPILTMLSLFMLAGCSDVIKEFRDPPGLSPVGEGLNRKDLHPPLAQYQPQPYKSYQSMWDQSRTEFFKEPRAKSVGDVLTVSIDISDEANLDNESGRSRSSNNDFGMDLGFGLFGMNEEGEGDLDISSNSGSNGKGAINRSENINLQVAAIVTQRLPNGNMVISGSQEVRVNFEVRVLSVEGIVRPRDIGPNNVITYDKIAEARISYGGRGRVSEVQKPAWGQRIYQTLTPF
ncbi:flagellar basal body L-ring protein FlgH [Cohaesibacter celericrescens]|nr:flagellar basal body L-ring protein FlgH [Cohaesibacter celericrescens]